MNSFEILKLLNTHEKKLLENDFTDIDKLIKDIQAIKQTEFNIIDLSELRAIQNKINKILKIVNLKKEETLKKTQQISKQIDAEKAYLNNDTLNNR